MKEGDSVWVLWNGQWVRGIRTDKHCPEDADDQPRGEGADTRVKVWGFVLWKPRHMVHTEAEHAVALLMS